jgi:site-specific DNA recombinase
VVFYRIDRLSRKQRHLLDAYEVFDKAGVALKSMTEPFDTSTPVGRFIMQMLGSMAELEREMIIDRTTSGRDRKIRSGHFQGGPVPFGYDVSDEGILAPSTRLTESGCTESKVLEMIFQKVAEGETLVEVCEWLNSQNVPSGKRYKSKTKQTTTLYKSASWLPGSLSKLLRNKIYIGEYTFKSKQEIIKVNVVPLISQTLFHLAHESTQRNIHQSKSTTRVNLLKGLIKCGLCGGEFVTTPMYSRGKYIDHYYRCTNQIPSNRMKISERCKAKQLKATAYEDMIWSACKGIILNPTAIIPAA